MSLSERNKMTLVWGVLGALVAAVFWLNRLANGHAVPDWSAIRLIGFWSLQLPFGISRWLDVPAVAALTAAFYRLATMDTVVANKSSRSGLLFSVLGGLLYGMFIHYGLLVAAGVALFITFALVHRLITGKKNSLVLACGWGLGASSFLFPPVPVVFAAMWLWCAISKGLGPWRPEIKAADDDDTH